MATIQQDAGQMVFGAFGGTLPSEADLTAALGEGALGGFMLFPHNLAAFQRGGVVDVVALATRLEALVAAAGAQPVPFVAIDQEGGLVQRLRRPLTSVPTAHDIGLLGDTDVARDMGRVLGRELRLLGFNLDFAPVADLWTNPANAVIGLAERAYGSDPEATAGMVAAVAEGLAEAEMLACVKHFPGHGDTEGDSHAVVARVTRGLDVLRANELVPFAAVASTIPMVMVGHLVVQALDPSLPFSLSPAGIGPLLRDELGFDGIVITDDLIMKGSRIVLDPAGTPVPGGGGSGLVERSIEEVVALGLDAGVDVFLSQDEWPAVHAALVALSVEPARAARIRESAERIRRVKASIPAWSRSATLKQDLEAMHAAHLVLTAAVPDSRKRVIGRGFAPPPPDCRIDYDRLGALPVGLPPAALAPDDLDLWVRAMDATAAVNAYERPGQDDLDPRLASDRRIARIAIGAGSSWVIAPRHLSAAVVAGRSVVTEARVDAVGRRGPLPTDPADRAAFYGLLGLRFVWDDEARATSAVPIPLFPDESVLVLWGTQAGVGLLPTLPAAVPGALDTPIDGQAECLLTTSPEHRGELDPTLVRAPHPGLVRFERYRHLTLDATDVIAPANPSHAGRLVVTGSKLPLVASVRRQLDPSSRSPWNEPITIVYENVDGASVATHLAALLWDQLVHLASLRGRARIAQDSALLAALEEAASLLLQSWRAWLDLRIFAGEPSADVAAIAGRAAATVRLDDVPMRGAALLAAAEAVLADPQLHGNLLAFLTGVYAPLLTGDGTADLLVPRATIADVGFGTAHGAQQGLLLALVSGPAPWLPVFAGAPLGRAAGVYTADGSPPGDPRSALLEGFTTFDLEALHLAGATRTWPGAPPPVDPAVFGSQERLDLSGFAAQRVGALLGIRLVPAGSPVAFTTRDWLDELVKGTTRKVFQPPFFDASGLGAVDHPLLVMLGWEHAIRARSLREQMDVFADTTAALGGVTTDMGRATATWWGRRLVLTDAGGNWPWLDFTTGSIRLDPPSPQDPYRRASPVSATIDVLTPGGRVVVHEARRAETRPFKRVMGFDDADLEAALAVTRVVRNAADLDRPVDLALVLALMDRENYRITSARRRGEEPEEFNNASANAIFHPGAAAVAGIPPEYQGREALGRYGARLVWCAQHYGMDRLVTPRPAQLVGPTSREFARSAAETFAAVVAELQVPDAKGRSLLDPAFLAALDVPAFLDPRLEFVFRSPVSMKADLRVASPRLQYVGIALQSALFQWFHRKLVQATGAAGDYRQVAEFIAAAPPDPGWDALSLERRDYIAYYAAVYLAYNTASGPGEWNFWMNFAESRRGSFSTADAARATTFLLVHGDPTGQSNRRKGQLGHLARFAVGLDAFLRLDVAGAGLFDFSDPGRRDGVWV